jgi:hypothetical protein
MKERGGSQSNAGMIFSLFRLTQIECMVFWWTEASDVCSNLFEAVTCEHADSASSPITNVSLQRSVPVRVPGRGRGSGSEARLGVTVRGVVTTTIMVTRVPTPIPSVPLGLLSVSLQCSRGLLCCLHTSSLVSAMRSCEAVVCLPFNQTTV